MKIVDNQTMLDAIDLARRLEELLRHDNPETAAAVAQEIERINEHKLTIAVVGLLKRGKSTFCNALLGRRDDLLAPTDEFPATGIITEFHSDEAKEYANVVFTNNSSQRITYEQIRSFVTEEENPENHKKVLRMEVYGNFELDPEIRLIDLPGDSSIHSYHSEIVYDYLPNADVIVFLSSADDPITDNELRLLRKVQPNEFKKVFFVINKMDACDEQALADAESHDRATLDNAGIAVENDIYRISAKKAMQGDFSEGDYRQLVEDISAFINDDRCRLLAEAFMGRVMALAAPAMRELSQNVEYSGMSKEELEGKISELANKKTVMQRELEVNLKEFSESWDAMLTEFSQQLPQVHKNVELKLVGEIQATSPYSIRESTIKALPEKVSVTIEQELSAATGVLEAKAKAALDKLEKSCPNISGFLSDQYNDVNVEKTTDGYGNWLFLLLSGAGAYGTGSMISGAFAIGSTWGASGGVLGSILGFLGTGVGTVAGGATTVLLGPVFMVCAIGLTFASGSILNSFMRKKNLRKERLIAELKKALHHSFDVIRFEKIPYLKQQKQELINEIKKDFELEMGRLDGALHEALENRRTNAQMEQVVERQRLMLTEYSSIVEELQNR